MAGLVGLDVKRARPGGGPGERREENG